MKRSTVELNFKLIRMAQGMLNAWQAWAIREGVDAGVIAAEEDPDPVAHFKATNNKPKQPRAQ